MVVSRKTIAFLATALACAAPATRSAPVSAPGPAHPRAHVPMAAAAPATAEEPATRAEELRCALARDGSVTGGACWSVLVSPTAEHRGVAEERKRIAADRRLVSPALRLAEASACAAIPAYDRDVSPFEHRSDIVSVTPLLETAKGWFSARTPGSAPMRIAIKRVTGAVVVFRAVPGMTETWLQRVVDCHLARNAALGHDVPEAPDCPLVPVGAEARVTATDDGFAIAVRSSDRQAGHEILERAERLRGEPPAVTLRDP